MERQVIRLERDELKDFNLANAHPDEDLWNRVSEALITAVTLEKLSINVNVLSDQGAYTIARGLAQNESLAYVYIGTSPRKADSSEALIRALIINTNIPVIRLGEVDDVLAVTLVELINENKTMSSLHISGLNVSNTGATIIREAMSANTTITKLNIQWVLEPEFAREVDTCDPLSDVLLANNSLSEFELAFPLSSAEAGSIGNAIPGNHSVTSLALRCARIPSIEPLCIGLRKAVSLHKLDLSGSNIQDIGAESMASMLQVNKSLTILHLDENDITSVGASVLLSALIFNTTLHRLDLSRNNIHHEIEGLSNVLGKNTALTELNLGHNKLGDEGAIAIAQALQKNRSLTWLDVSVNEIGRKGAESVLKALEANTDLPLIHLNFNNSNIWMSAVQRDLVDCIEGKKSSMKEAFIEVLHSNAQAPWQRGKLMVIGREGVGKSALVQSLLERPFEPAWNSTIGIHTTEVKTTEDVIWKQTTLRNLAGELVNRLAHNEKVVQNLHTRSTQGNDAVSGRTRLASTKIESVTSAQQTMARRKELEEELKRKSVQNEKDAKKFDIESFVESQHEQQAIRISIWDFGGQAVFHTLQHLFLTVNGVYLLVFDMVWLLRDKSLRDLRYWLHSLSIHAATAPVILIGTFLDSVEPLEKLSELEELLESSLRKELLQMCYRPPGNPFCFTPVSNKDGTGIPKLREFVKSVMMKQKSVSTPVSVRWMRSLDLLLDLAHANNSNWIKYEKFREAVKVFDISQALEVEEMLSLFHEFGVTIYFSKTESLRQTIVTKPQWLLDNLSKVIRDPLIHVSDEDIRNIETVRLEDDFSRFNKTGLVSRDLLEYFWHGEEVDYLIDLMEHLLLLSTWSLPSAEGLYLVPSMVKRNPDFGPAVGPYEGKMQFDLLFDGVFERVVCLCVAYGQKQKLPELTVNKALLWLNSSTGPVLITTHMSNESLRSTSTDEIGSEVLEEEQNEFEKSESCIQVFANDEQTVSFALSLIHAMLVKVKTDLSLSDKFSWTSYVKKAGEYKEFNRRRPKKGGLRASTAQPLSIESIERFYENK